jgi:hypothetical protein
MWIWSVTIPFRCCDLLGVIVELVICDHAGNVLVDFRFVEGDESWRSTEQAAVAASLVVENLCGCRLNGVRQLVFAMELPGGLPELEQNPRDAAVRELRDEADIVGVDLFFR